MNASDSPSSVDSLLTNLGWSARFAADPAHDLPSTVPARVVRQERGLYHLLGAGPPLLAEVSGRLRHQALGPLDLPVVGDWVRCAPRAGEDRATIHAVYARRTLLARQAAGTDVHAQPLAANVDQGLVVSAANRDLNPRRVERYLSTLWEAGIEPVVVLNKVDLCASDLEDTLAELESAAPGATVLPVSAVTGAGFEAVAALVRPGRTLVVVGSSGVGKSTIVNRLLGRDVQDTGPARVDDDRGRHTTTRRDLVLLDAGGVLIDTPGLRELAPWEAESGVERTFAEVEALAAECRFRDCAHELEPGCAIQAAVARGDLDPERLLAYGKLRRELARQARKLDHQARREVRQRNKRLSSAVRRRQVEKYGRSG